MALILVVEDDPLIAMVLGEVLNDEGHTVSKATNRNEAAKGLHASPLPNIVLLDLYLAGRRSCHTLLAMIPSSVLVILVTGVEFGSADFPPKSSYSAYISKPFDVNELISVVNKVLRDQRKLDAGSA